MSANGNLIRVIAAIFVLAAPALGLRVFSNYYEAPHLQPLALTSESVAAAEDRKGGAGIASIDVRVAWGQDWDGTMTRDRLRNAIVTTLDRRAEYYNIEFEDLPGEQIEVTFIVGPNSYGPYPPGQMINGITSALTAYKMTNGPKG